jgi:DNA modification methylase
MKFEQWPISRLVEYARNPRKNDHAVDRIASAIKEFGFRIPVVAKSDGSLVDGHLRLKAAKKLNLETVPVILADDLTEAQIKAFRISVNKMAEFAEWDNELLALEFDELKELDFDLDLTGFSAEEINALMPVELNAGLTDEDDCPEVNDNPVTVNGDIWLLGKHRLMCGDSTSIDAVEKLMDGQKADMVFTDPPYGMKLDADYSDMSSKFKGSKGGNKYANVIGDHDDFSPDLIQTVFANFVYCKEIFLWGADYYADLLPDRNNGSWIVWDKRCDDSADKMFGSTFELCWSRTRHKRDMARIKWAGIFGMEKEHDKKRVHPTQKPVELVAWFFDQWGKDCNIVADLFGGSGSTLIACEKTNRIARLMELDPKYCDVIIKRWQDFTGKKATLDSDGRTFEDVAAGRVVEVVNG